MFEVHEFSVRTSDCSNEEQTTNMHVAVDRLVRSGNRHHRRRHHHGITVSPTDADEDRAREVSSTTALCVLASALFAQDTCSPDSVIALLMKYSINTGLLTRYYFV